MNSLYHRLSAWLLASLGIVWLVVGFSVYVTVRTSLEGRFDAELRAMASEVRYLLPEGRNLQTAKPSAYWFDFYQPDSGLYFEVWDEYLLFSDRSTSLGDRELPRPPAFSEKPRIWNATLATGEKIRIIAQRLMQFRPARLGTANDPADAGYPLNVVVARNRNALDRSLRLLLAATGLAGVLLIPVTFLTMRLAVSRGLRPLRDFADRTTSFGIDSLSERFQTEGVPAELGPISKRLNELMDRLAAGIERERRLNEDLAHELRTPVAELKTMAEVALAWPDQINGENYQEVLEAANQMQSLIDNMLLLARWERNTERPAMEPVDLAEMVEKCFQPLAEAANAKGLRIRKSITPGGTLQTNPELFRIILSNLIANAIEYSPEGGELTIESHSGIGPSLLTVSNSVANLDPQDVPHLFERFWRRDSARRATGHAGLGLPLAKSCAAILSLDLAAELNESTKHIVFSLTACSRESTAPAWEIDDKTKGMIACSLEEG